MRIKFAFLGLVLAACFTVSPLEAANLNLGENSVEMTYIDGGGKEKSKKKVSSKPSATARKSAKGAIRAEKTKAKQIQARASVRHFFHRLFNAKPGKARNFRKRSVRNRWKRGR